MNNSVNMNVVHESEAQRQFARVKLPANIKYKDQDNYISNKVIDVSAGGFSMAVNSDNYKKNEVYKGVLSFVIDKVTIGLNVNFQVSTEDLKHGQVGCIFQNLGEREISSLRYIISSYLAGELVTAGSVINTLQRDNFTKDRKNKIDNTQSGFARFRAIMGSLLFLTAGALAFFFIINSLYSTLFVTDARSGIVDSNKIYINSNLGGKVKVISNVNSKVRAGTPLASFSTTVYDVSKSSLSKAINATEIETLLNKDVKSILESPCDCTVKEVLVSDGQYLEKGERIFELVPNNTASTISAFFPYEQLSRIKEGETVNLTFPGESKTYKGVIKKLSLVEGREVPSVKAVVESTERELTPQMVDMPVGVTIGSSILGKIKSLF